MVQAFNKAKHAMPVYAQREEDKPVLYFAIGDSDAPLRNYRMELNPARARWFAFHAAQIQVVLHDTLAVVLVYRYGDKYEPVSWAQIVLGMPDWAAEAPS